MFNYFQAQVKLFPGTSLIISRHKSESLFLLPLYSFHATWILKWDKIKMAQIALRNASGWNVRKEILYWIAHIVRHCIVCCGEFSIALGIWWSSGVQAESSPQHQYRNRAELTRCRGNSRNSHLDIFFIQNRLSQGEGRSKYIFAEEENNENKM